MEPINFNKSYLSLVYSISTQAQIDDEIVNIDGLDGFYDYTDLHFYFYPFRKWPILNQSIHTTVFVDIHLFCNDFRKRFDHQWLLKEHFKI